MKEFIDSTTRHNNTKRLNHQGVLVIKCGGSIINNVPELTSLIEDIAALKNQGYQITMVHGGGPDINQLCSKLNLKNSFVNGLRVTTPEILNITQMTLIGKTNTGLVHKFNQAKLPALGLSGHDLNLLTGDFIDEENLGFVGMITQVNIQFLTKLFELGIIPVIAPLAVDSFGNTFNINADLAAAAVAKALNADKLILLSDIDGFYANYPDKNSLIANLTTRQVEDLLVTPGAVTDGMNPKLTACLTAVTAMVKTAHIVNGNVPHVLTQVVNPLKSIGTTVIKENKQ